MDVLQIGSFFMINLCLVVIATQFSETKRRETERMLAERAQRAQQKNRSRSDSTIASSSGGLDVAGCYVELVRYLEYLAGTARRRLARLVRRLRRRHAAAAAAADRPPPAIDAAASSGRRHRRRRRRDFDRRPSDDAPAELADPTPAAAVTDGVVACRSNASAETTTDAQDAQSPSVTASPRRTKSVMIARSDCLQITNTGASTSR